MSRRFTPGVPDLIFGLVLVSVLVGGRFRLLNDPGTLWHLRLGREIVKTGCVPRADALTFTRAGERWVDQSWLFDAALAFVVDRGGWSAAALACALGVAAIYAGLARGLLRGEDGGRSPMAVVVVAMVAAGVGTVHFLIRPHLFTLGFVMLTLRVCRAQHESGGRGVFSVPLLTVVWANVHGGFLAGPFIVLTAAIGHAVSGRWDAARRRNVAAFLASAGLCLIAALVNPYGFDLYRHVGKLLVSSGVTDLIDEYQPIQFGKPDARAFELVLLALMALPCLSARRMTVYELSHAAVWLHLSLGSVRHAPLFALAVAPGLARLLDGLTTSTEPNDVDADGWSVWPALAAIGLTVAAAFGMSFVRFDPAHWPYSALPALNRAPEDARLFHEQDWGGLIEAESRPPRPAYIDDRFELFGKSGVLEYMNAVEGGPDWDVIRDRHAIRLVWVRPERGLARRLAADPSWRTRHKDAVSVLFERTGGPGQLARPGSRTDGQEGFDFSAASFNPVDVDGPREEEALRAGGTDRAPRGTHLERHDPSGADARALANRGIFASGGCADRARRPLVLAARDAGCVSA